MGKSKNLNSRNNNGMRGFNVAKMLMVAREMQELAQNNIRNEGFKTKEEQIKERARRIVEDMEIDKIDCVEKVRDFYRDYIWEVYRKK